MSQETLKVMPLTTSQPRNPPKLLFSLYLHSPRTGSSLPYRAAHLPADQPPGPWKLLLKPSRTSTPGPLLRVLGHSSCPLCFLFLHQEKQDNEGSQNQASVTPASTNVVLEQWSPSLSHMHHTDHQLSGF